MAKYCIEIVYCGKEFYGFQSQTGGSTIQDCLEEALRIFFRKKINIYGASSTDSGVHAFKQVATFELCEKFEIKQCLRGLNALLPTSIGISSLIKVDTSFDAIRSAKAKVYRYKLHLGKCINPFLLDYCWSVPESIDLNSLEDAANMFIGRHDFSAFCSIDSSAKTKIRTITEIICIRREKCFEVWIMGEGFLKQMIRIIVGTLVEVGLSKKTSENVRNILLKKDRKEAGKTLPAKGLTLIEIF